MYMLFGTEKEAKIQILWGQISSIMDMDTSKTHNVSDIDFDAKHLATIWSRNKRKESYINRLNRS